MDFFVSKTSDNSSRINDHPGTHRILFESAPDAMLVTDREGYILKVNAETEEQFGYSRQELIGELVEKLIPLHLREAHQIHRQTYQQAPYYRPMGHGLKLFALHKDGHEFPVEISLNPVVTETGTLFYCVIRDTSEREATLGELERHLNLSGY